MTVGDLLRRNQVPHEMLLMADARPALTPRSHLRLE